MSRRRKPNSRRPGQPQRGGLGVAVYELAGMLDPVDWITSLAQSLRLHPIGEMSPDETLLAAAFIASNVDDRGQVRVPQSELERMDRFIGLLDAAGFLADREAS